MEGSKESDLIEDKAKDGLGDDDDDLCWGTTTSRGWTDDVSWYWKVEYVVGVSKWWWCFERKEDFSFKKEGVGKDGLFWSLLILLLLFLVVVVIEE